uniref:Uncharacterized protein LOC117357639 isoform X2 n=1 Tax=Geotrypetes seraphini TaxID=260995 RepID=A0A6P8QEY6_GEOSA|nr:uncharacterized protein LOC117357639 isoform X2 [Geotrypetes seraphini]
MSDVYQISSTERIQLLEKQLATQLAELKTEIEENGVLLGTPNRVYSSVPIPKDVSYFRREREMVLRQGLQVADAKSLGIQADVLQKELESCLRHEYTAESMPLLLHQFFTDRIPQLVQSKYLHLLRWRRFCQHSSTIEHLYPLYQKQVGYIMQEYNDAVQRAQRLAIARENFLTDQRNAASLVTQEDLVIYLQWFVCHLYSLKNIHNYLRVLQYLPLSDRAEVVIEKVSRKAQGHEDDASASPIIRDLPASYGLLSSDPANLLPQHQTETEVLKPRLHDLLAHFKIAYDVADLKNTVNEMELLSLVVRRFQSVFSQQQTMRTFPGYDTGETPSENWGMTVPSKALKKDANWVPFIKIKAKQDPWQQKFLSKLKQQRKVDELLRLQSQLSEVSTAEQVMEALQEHAAVVLEAAPVRSLSAQDSIHVWTRIYRNMDHQQGLPLHESTVMLQEKEMNANSGDVWKHPLSSGKMQKTGYSYQTTLQLLGLDEEKHDDTKNPVMLHGAYLSFLYLRHLRIRELQRLCLGILNYFRSVERSLTISICGLTLSAGKLVSTPGDQPRWVDAARGGSGTAGGLGSHQYMHSTPADFQVQSAQFMEFSEVDNHDDYYSVDSDSCMHTQDQRGAYIVYDVALCDLKELEEQLLLVATQYMESERSFRSHKRESGDEAVASWAHAMVDRFAVLLDLWYWEATLLKDKQQLLDSYYEAYQHAVDPEERFGLAQVMTKIMYRRPRFDFGRRYFVSSYQDECFCLQLHQQLVKDVLNKQIDTQREYVQKIWRGGQKGGVAEFGLPLNVISKQLVSINNSRPALKNIYLLEFHTSLGFVSLIPRALEHVFQEFEKICRPQTASQAASLEKEVLQLVLDEWLNMKLPQTAYSTQLHRDLFADVLIEDPLLMKELAFSMVESAALEGELWGREKQALVLDTFSRLLEIITLRHRFVEAALESALLARFYKVFAAEMGYDEFHLYLRPVQFEFASGKMPEEHLPPTFITALLEDNSSVDRYAPSSFPLSIHEIDENHIGKFSFYSREGMLQLVSRAGVSNLQVALACQVTQRNALLVAVQQASYCSTTQLPAPTTDAKERRHSIRRQSSSLRDKSSKSGKEMESQTSYPAGHPSQRHWNKRPPEAFVSIQLEKVGPRDVMLNTFIQRRDAASSKMVNADEIEKSKRELITEYCHRVNSRMSQYSLRGQIIACCTGLRALLEDFPTIRDTYFMLGQPNERKGDRDTSEGQQADPRTFQKRPRSVLSADGRCFLNLWFVPHSSELLIMFKTLPEKAMFRALYHTLQILAALHDIVAFLCGFAQLGNSSSNLQFRKAKTLTADWGGTEGIGTELVEIQRLIDSLTNPQEPKRVAELLLLRREVLLLQFSVAVRHSIREAFLSAGNITAYQRTTDNAGHGLLPLSNAVARSAVASQLPLPQPLEPRSHKAFMLFPWRTFLADGGLFPFTISSLHDIDHDMQLCLCDLSDQERSMAHGELVGVQLLMEEVLQGGHELISFHLEDRDGQDTSSSKGKQPTVDEGAEVSTERPQPERKPSTDPVTAYALLQSFLIIWIQLEVFKEAWGRIKLHTEDINTLPLYKQFVELYRVEILGPAMKTVARHMGQEIDPDRLGTADHFELLPQGASEVEIRRCQLQKILESLEGHMIHEVQKKLAKEMTLVISERAKEGRGLPTELWKAQCMKESFSVPRPQILEKFVQRLMEESQHRDNELAFNRDHLQRCLTSLGCDIMARERSNFETYSMFYENVLQQEHRLLYQKEQEIQAAGGGQKEGSSAHHISQVADLSHGMIMEITALRTRLSESEEEQLTLKESVRKDARAEYEALVRMLFATCVDLKYRLDQYHLNMHRQVYELISDVRKEGLDSIAGMKKASASTKEDHAEKDRLAKEELQAVQKENVHLEELLCKMKALGRWKETIKEGQLRAQLRNTEEEAIRSKKASLKVKMLAERETFLLQEQLKVVRATLAKSQAESRRIQKQLEQQKQLLKKVEHRVAEDNRSRQQLDSVKTSSMEKLLEDLSAKDQQLQYLTEEMEKSSKISQQQQAKIHKEIHQMKAQLTQERSLKLDAFQRVDELQAQVYDFEVASERNSSAGLRKKSASLMLHSPNTARNPSAGTGLWPQFAEQSEGGKSRSHHQYSLTPEPQGIKAGGDRRLERPKTVSSSLYNASRYPAGAETELEPAT